MKQTKFLTFLLLIYFQSFGGGFQINTMGQRALSMGGSLTALSLDASITFFNPGGMSFLKNNSVMIGATAIMPKTAFLSALDGKQVDMESQTFFPFYVYGSYHINEKISAGISINTPFGLGTKWNDEWEGRYITQEAKLKTIYFQPTLSYKVSEKFAVGAGVVFTTGKAELKKAIPVQGASTAYGTGALKGSASGFGYSIGVFISPNEKSSLGVSYRSGVNLKVDDGDASFENIPSSASEIFPSSTSFTTTLKMPSVISIAIGHRFTEDVRAQFEVNYTGWKTFDAIDFDFPEAYSELNASSNLERQYKNAVAVRLGAEWDVNTKFTLRAGAVYDQTPVKDGYVSPDLPDANKYAFAGGLGYNVNDQFTIDVSYAFESIKERQDKNTQTQLDGSFKTYIHAIGLGLSYEF